MYQSKNAIGNLINRYRAVLKKCNLLNVFGSLAIAGMVVAGMSSQAFGVPEPGEPGYLNSWGLQTTSGGRIEFVEPSSGTYIHTQTTDPVVHTLVVNPDSTTGKIELTRTADTHAMISASLQSNTAAVCPVITFNGGQGTSLTATVNDSGDPDKQGYIILARFAKVYIGSAENPFDNITLISNDTTGDGSIIYVTDGNDSPNAGSQDLQIYGKTISLTASGNYPVAILGNEGQLTMQATDALNITGNILAFNKVYGGHGNLHYYINQNANNTAKTTLTGFILAGFDSVIKIGLKGDGSSITGDINASKQLIPTGKSPTDHDGGILELSFGKNGIINGNIVAGDYDAATETFASTYDGGSVTITGDDTVTINGTVIVGENSTFTAKNIKISDQTAHDTGGVISSKGVVNIDGGIFENNISNTSFGAIRTRVSGLSQSGKQASSITLTNCTFTNNTATDVGAVGLFYKATISNSSFIGNKTTDQTAGEGNGGAIFCGSESMSTLTNVIFQNNESTGSGGAIYTREANGKNNSGAKLDIINSEFTGNKAVDGGAISNTFYHSTTNTDFVTISGSTFNDNTAGTDGGAIYNNMMQDIENMSGKIYIENSTFTKNTALGGNGGAIYNAGEIIATGKYGEIVFAGTNIFSDNKAKDGAGNDIYNDGKITIENGTTTLGSGYAGDGNLTVNAGATLELLADSTIGGTFTNNGTLNMQNPSPTINTIDVATLKGNSTLKIDVNVANQTADTLNITTTASGATVNLTDIKVVNSCTPGDYSITYIKGETTGLTTTVAGTDNQIVTTDGIYTYVFTSGGTGILSLNSSLINISLQEYIAGATELANAYTSYNVNSDLSASTFGATGGPAGRSLVINLNNGKTLSGDGTGTGISILNGYSLTLDGSSAENATMSMFKTALNNAGTLNVNAIEFNGNGTDVINTGTMNISGKTALDGILSQDGGKTVVAQGANLELYAATFQNKTESVSGSALENSGTIDFNRTTSFNNNTGTNGGAIYNAPTGTLNFYNSTTFTGNKATGSGDSIKNDGVINFNSIANFTGTGTNPVDIYNEGTVNVNTDSYVTLSSGTKAYTDDITSRAPQLVFNGGTLSADFANFLNISEKSTTGTLSKNTDSINGKITDTTEGGTLILRSAGAFGSDTVAQNEYTSDQLVQAKSALGLTNALLSFKDATLKLAENEEIIAEQQNNTATISNISVVKKNDSQQITSNVTDVYDATIAKVTETGTTKLATVDTVNMESSNFSIAALQVNPAAAKISLTTVDCSVTFTGKDNGLVVNAADKAVKTELTIGGTKEEVSSGGASTVIIAGDVNISSINADGTNDNSILVISEGAALNTESITTKSEAKDLIISVAGKLAVAGDLDAMDISAQGASITAQALNLKRSLQMNSGSQVTLKELITPETSADEPIVISVGSDTAQSGGDTLIVENMKLTKYVNLLVDPAWGQESAVVAVENIGDSSSMGDIVLTGRAGVGQNSMLTVGTTNQNWLTMCLKKATGSGLEENKTTAAFGLFKSLDLSGNDSGAIVVNGSFNDSRLSAAVATADAGSVTFADNSFFAVNGKIAGTSSDTAALKAKTITVGDNSKLYVSNVQVARKYYIANASNKLTLASGSWSDDNLTVDNALLDVTLKTDSNSAWLDVTVGDVAVLLPKLDPALSRAANTLIAIDGNGGLDSDNYAARFINRASTYITDKNHAAATIEGSAKLAFAGAVPQMNLDLAQRMNNALTSRDFLNSAPGIGAASGNTENGFALWALPTYQYSSGDGFKSGNFKNGYEANVGGLALGGDYTLNNSVRLGLAINGGGGKVETDGGDYNETKNDINYIGVNAYASWKLNSFSLFGQIGFLRTNNDLSQKTPTAMGMADSKADDVHSTVFTLGMRASYQFNTKWIDIMPYLGLDYYNVHTSAFAVKSDGFAMFNGDNIDANYLQIPVGVNMKKTLTEANGWNVKAALDLSVIPNIGSHKATQNIRLQGLTTDANIGQVITDECTGRAVVGIEAKKGNFGFGLNYSFQGGNHTTNHGVQGMVNWKF